MRVLVLDPIANEAQAERVLRALASPNRIRILTLLTNRSISVNDIAAILELPLSTAAAHIEALEEAELIHATFEPASRGLKKVCIRIADRVILKLPMAEELRSNAVEISMPVGAYSDCHVVPTCGLVSDLKGIGFVDDPASFYEPHRIDAQLVWFHQGYVEYRFPNRIPGGVRVDSLRLSMEICSEAPLSNNNWPSDITVWINGTELGTWTSPADFGGERGRLTPEWWERESTQYGLLKTWHGWFMNSLFISTSITVLVLFLSSLSGYAFARLDMPGRDVIFFILLCSLMIPGAVTLIPVFLLLRDLNFLDSYHAVIWPAGAGVGGIFLLRQQFLTFPKELEEAAIVDGAGRFRIYWQIALPLARGSMVALAIVTFLGSWNDLFWPLIVLSDRNELTLPVGLAILGQGNYVQRGITMAAAVIASSTPFVLYLFLQRRIVSGLATSGLAGR